MSFWKNMIVLIIVSLLPLLGFYLGMVIQYNFSTFNKFEINWDMVSAMIMGVTAYFMYEGNKTSGKSVQEMKQQSIQNKNDIRTSKIWGFIENNFCEDNKVLQNKFNPYLRPNTFKIQSSTLEELENNISILFEYEHTFKATLIKIENLLEYDKEKQDLFIKINDIIKEGYRLLRQLNQLILRDQKFDYHIVSKTIKDICGLYDCIEYLVYILDIKLLEGIEKDATMIEEYFISKINDVTLKENFKRV